MTEQYYNTIQWDEAELQRWRNDSGDTNHLLNWNLNENSKVVDIGSYSGKWIKDIFNKYKCYGLGFEPTKRAFAESLPAVNDKITFVNFGISVNETGVAKINVDSDKSSISNSINESSAESVTMINAKEVFENILKDDLIDLLQINIEGYEYELLPYMIEHNLLKNVKAIQIQFHNISNLSDEKRKNICEGLKMCGFNTKFDYKFVWYGGEKL